MCPQLEDTKTRPSFHRDPDWPGFRSEAIVADMRSPTKKTHAVKKTMRIRKHYRLHSESKNRVSMHSCFLVADLPQILYHDLGLVKQAFFEVPVIRSDGVILCCQQLQRFLGILSVVLLFDVIVLTVN